MLFISTAIPYVNARPHIGHAFEFVQTDAMARYLRLLGRDVYFLTGADENSLKNVRAAQEEGISTQALCDRNTEYFRALLPALNISNDEFIRTSGDLAPGASFASIGPQGVFVREIEQALLDGNVDLEWHAQSLEQEVAQVPGVTSLRARLRWQADDSEVARFNPPGRAPLA